MRMCVWRTTSSPSVVNVIRRCLPFDSTAFTVPPTTCRRAADGVTFAATSSKPVTTRPASARRSTVAVRKIVSPSGTPSGPRDAPEIAARRTREAGLAQGVRDGRLVHGGAIDRLDEEGGPPIGADFAGERGRERVPRRLGVSFFGDEGEELLFAAAQPPREAPVDENDQRARDSHRFAALGALGPRQCRAVGVRGIGRREDDGVRLLPPLARRARPINNAAERGLRRRRG